MHVCQFVFEAPIWKLKNSAEYIPTHVIIQHLFIKAIPWYEQKGEYSNTEGKQAFGILCLSTKFSFSLNIYFSLFLILFSFTDGTKDIYF